MVSCSCKDGSSAQTKLMVNGDDCPCWLWSHLLTAALAASDGARSPEQPPQTIAGHTFAVIDLLGGDAMSSGRKFDRLTHPRFGIRSKAPTICDRPRHRGLSFLGTPQKRFATRRGPGCLLAGSAFIVGKRTLTAIESVRGDNP